MATLSFEDRIKQLVKQRLNPDTEDLMKRKATAEADYYGPETLDFDKFSGVSDPMARRRLVDQENQMAMATNTSLGGALQNREVGITDLVGSFAKARQEEAEIEKEENARQMQEAELSLRQQEMAGNANYRNAQLALDKSKADREEIDPLDQMVSSLVAQGVPQDTARRIAMTSSFEANADLNKYLNPPVTPTGGGGGSGFSSLLGGGVGALGGRAAGAALGSRLGAAGGALGGPVGMAIGGLAGAGVGAMTPEFIRTFQEWKARNGK